VKESVDETVKKQERQTSLEVSEKVDKKNARMKRLSY